MSSLSSTLVLLLTALAISSLHAEWTRYRGPNGTGAAPEGSGPPVEWSETRNLLWKTKLPGPGSSCPIVTGDQIFVTAYSGYGDWSEGELADLKRHVLSIDLNSGEILWDRTIPNGRREDPFEGFLNEHGYASNTPVTDGEHVYAFFGKAGLVAYDLAGEEIWRKPVGQLSGGKIWGSAASPILHEGLLIVNQHDEDRALVAYEKATGKEVWKVTDKRMDLAYGTPAIMAIGGREDLVTAIPGEAWGLDPLTGATHWWRSIPVTGNISASVLFHGPRVFVFGGYPRTMRIAFDVTGDGDLSGVPLAWESTRAAYLQTPVIVEDRLHWISDTGFARCADIASGELIYDERMPNASGSGSRGKPFYASPVLAGGRIYAVSRTQGTFVLEAGEKFKVIAQNKLDDETLFNAAPAVVGNRLLIRSQGFLYCIGEK